MASKKRRWAEDDNSHFPKYGVPRTTLSDRIRGIVSMDSKMGRPQIISVEDEDALVRYIRYSETWELGTPKGLSKTVLNFKVVLFRRFISMY